MGSRADFQSRAIVDIGSETVSQAPCVGKCRKNRERVGVCQCIAAPVFGEGSGAECSGSAAGGQPHSEEHRLSTDSSLPMDVPARPRIPGLFQGDCESVGPIGAELGVVR